MKVTLKAKTDLSVSGLASHAARVCYSINPETINQPIDVKARLFEDVAKNQQEQHILDDKGLDGSEHVLPPPFQLGQK